METRPDTPSPLICIQCSYDLRLIDPAGVCPECGTSIETSIIAFNHPLKDQQRTVYIGAVILLLSLIARLGLLAIALAVEHDEPPTWTVMEFLSVASSSAVSRSAYPLFSLRLTSLPLQLFYCFALLVWLAEWIGIMLTARLRLQGASLFQLAARWGLVLGIVFAVLTRYSPWLSVTGAVIGLTSDYIAPIIVAGVVLWIAQILKCDRPRWTDRIAAIVAATSQIAFFFVAILMGYETAGAILVALSFIAFVYLAARLVRTARPRRVDVQSNHAAACSM